MAIGRYCERDGCRGEEGVNQLAAIGVGLVRRSRRVEERDHQRHSNQDWIDQWVAVQPAMEEVANGERPKGECGPKGGLSQELLVEIEGYHCVASEMCCSGCGKASRARTYWVTRPVVRIAATVPAVTP